MNAREKKIAILAYQVAIEKERDNVKNGFHRRTSDSPLGMAINWATQAEFDNTWCEMEDKLNE